MFKNNAPLNVVPFFRPPDTLAHCWWSALLIHTQKYNSKFQYLDLDMCDKNILSFDVPCPYTQSIDSNRANPRYEYDFPQK